MLAAGAQTSTGISVSEVEKVEAAGFDALGREWNELLAASEADCLFLTWEWLHTWWKHLAEDRELAIRVVREGGRLTALAPLARRPARASFGHAFPVLEFLGSGHVGSDYLDVIARAGHAREAVQALAEGLRRERAVMKWVNLGPEACATRLAAELEEAGWSVEPAEINVCPYIPLEGKTWESYLAELGAEHRYNFHRKWKRLNREFAISFDRVRTADECRAGIELAMDLHKRRWRGDSDAFHTPELTAFHREFAPLAWERGWLRLYVLRANERPVACLYGFLYGGRFYFYQSGFDPEYEKYSTGLVTMGLSIRSAIEEGAREFDLLHGDEAYKSHWSRERRKLMRLELYPPGLGGKLSQASMRWARVSKKLASRVLANCL